MKLCELENWIIESEGLRPFTRRRLEELQLSRLNYLLTREREHGGFYSNLPLSLPSLDALRTLPFTTAEDLAVHGPGLLLTSQACVSRVISDRTSGTTGFAKRVFYSESDCLNTVGFFAAGLAELVFPGDVVMIAMPFSGPRGLGDLIAAAVRRLGAQPLEAGTGKTFGELAALLRGKTPSVYVGMPVPLLSLLRLCGRGSLRRALVSGDACPEGLLREAERLLGSRLFPHYGSRELALGGAVTCPAHEGMHLRENHIIAEIIGENGEPLPAGEWGELVITTIGMEAQPLIRYRSGDFTRILPEPCPCGGITRRLDTVTRAAKFDISRLDSLLFSLPYLVDYGAAMRGETLYIAALTLGGCSEERLRADLARLLPGLKTDCELRPATDDDLSKYVEKRYILQ
ncbi:MAG: AMP-binding protein [Oscillospiraceae bacterium]